MRQLTDLVTRVVVAVSDQLGHDPEELRSRADDLLSRPPYTDAEPGLMSRALRWLGEALARALQVVIDGIGATGRVGAWLIVAVATVLLALVVWRQTRGSTLDRRAPEVPAPPVGRTAASWASVARGHEADGEFREAVRCWYAALAVGLVEQGIVDDVPGRTVRELNAEVARVAPALEGEVRRAGSSFEAIVYGEVPATDEAVRSIRDAADLHHEAPV